MRMNHIQKPNGYHLVAKQAGFTLIEIMVVVVIIGILTAMIGANIFGRVDQARITAAQADIQSISNAIQMYKLDNYNYPSTEQGLQALVTKPSGEPEAKNWNKDGYLPKLPVDPWGNEYLYISPGSHGPFDLSSQGPDAKTGTEDDVSNWTDKKS